MVRNYLGSKSKKGNAVLDLMVIIVVLFMFSIIIIFGKMITSEIRTDWDADPDFNNESKTAIIDADDQYVALYSSLFLLAFILLWALVLVASFNIDTHPIFFVFTLILLIFVFFIGALISNVYDDIAQEADIQPTASQFPIISLIMDNLLIVAIIVGMSIALVLYGKSR